MIVLILIVRMLKVMMILIVRMLKIIGVIVYVGDSVEDDRCDRCDSVEDSIEDSIEDSVC